MSYASVHKAREVFLLWVMCLLIGAFVIATAMMFVHPSVAILIFFIGLTVALVSGAVEFVFRRSERSAAKHELRADTCPECGEIVRGAAGGWRCQGCGSTFLPSGERAE